MSRPPCRARACPRSAASSSGLVAGPDEAVEPVAPLLRPMCREVVRCGPVPAGTGTKLAVNLYLCTMVAGLAEAYHLAAALDLDLAVFQRPWTPARWRAPSRP